MKKILFLVLTLACSTEQGTADSLTGPLADGAAAGGAGSSLDGQPPAQGGRGGTTPPPPGTDGGLTASGGSPSPPVDASPALPDGADAQAIQSDAGAAPDSSAVGSDARAKVDVAGDAGKLTVVVQPGAVFTGDVAMATMVLAKRCEGLGNGDGKACEIGVSGFGYVTGKCWNHFCCPGCWNGSTCLVTITSNTTNANVSDAACGSRGSMCMACGAPQTCKQETVPGGVVVTSCQN